MSTCSPSASRAGPLCLGGAWRGAWLLALGLMLAGCPEGGPTEPDPSLRLELGTGQQFTPLADGDALQIHQGCQGGQHIFVSLRAWGLPPNPVMVDLSLTRTEDEQRVAPPYRVRFLFKQGTGEAPDELPGQVFQLTQPEQAVGRTVRLRAAVETDAGQLAEDSHTGPLEWGDPACP